MGFCEKNLKGMLAADDAACLDDSSAATSTDQISGARIILSYLCLSEVLSQAPVTSACSVPASIASVRDFHMWGPMHYAALREIYLALHCLRNDLCC